MELGKLATRPKPTGLMLTTAVLGYGVIEVRIGA